MQYKIKIVTPNANVQAGIYVIRAGVHIYIYVCLWTKKCNSTLEIFSNIRSRSSHPINRLALPLLSQAMLSSLSKSRSFLYNVHLALFVRMDNTINASVSVVML